MINNSYQRFIGSLNANAAIKGFRLDIENAVGIDFNHFLRLGSIGKSSR